MSVPLTVKRTASQSREKSHAGGAFDKFVNIPPMVESSISRERGEPSARIRKMSERERCADSSNAIERTQVAGEERNHAPFSQPTANDSSPSRRTSSAFRDEPKAISTLLDGVAQSDTFTRKIRASLIIDAKRGACDWLSVSKNTGGGVMGIAT